MEYTRNMQTHKSRTEQSRANKYKIRKDTRIYNNIIQNKKRRGDKKIAHYNKEKLKTEKKRYDKLRYDKQI